MARAPVYISAYLATVVPGIIVLWARGYTLVDRASLSAGVDRPQVGLVSEMGAISVVIRRFGHHNSGLQASVGGTPPMPMRYTDHLAGEPDVDIWGFGFQHSRHWGQSTVFTIPYWFVLVASAVFPLRWMVKWRRSAGQPALMLCTHCGYDCRASPDYCPECGSRWPGQKLATRKAAL